MSKLPATQEPQRTLKINCRGICCSSFFYIAFYVQPRDTIKSLIERLEQSIPCVKISRLVFEGNTLAGNHSIRHYNISNDAIIEVKTNTEQTSADKPACMGCSYYNIMYLSANVARSDGSNFVLNPELIKASIREWVSKCTLNDQQRILGWFNDISKYSNIRFMVAARDMLETYVTKYRNMKHVNLVKFDYVQLLNELRCPICFSKFSPYQGTSKIAVRVCATSSQHYICQECFQKVDRCPICRGELQSQVSKSQYLVSLLQASKDKIEEYCFPESLTDISIGCRERPVANGAFCNVYKVQNYAIKCPRVPVVADSDIEYGVIHEIFLSRPLSHIPNILTVYGGIRLPDFGISIVAEFINGPSLANALVNKTILKMSLDERLNIALGICKGLGELHLAGIVHRDFKPENVLLQLCPDGRTYIPKIADFGVSFLIQTASATAVKKAAGTVGYDAPEVADGEVPSFKADIYALSFTIYELLTVQRPFAGLKDTQIIRKFTMAGERPNDWDVPTMHKEVLTFPDCLKEIVEIGWSPEPESRATIGEIIRAVRRALDPWYETCVSLLPCVSCDSMKTTYEFLDQYNVYELMAIQEIIKRLVIEDSEAIHLLSDHYVWA